MGKAWAKQLSSEYKRTKLSLVICVLLILTINPNLGQQWFLDSLTCIEPLLFVNSVAWSKRSRVVLTFHSGLFEPLNLFPKITLLEKKVEYAFLKCLVYATEFCTVCASASPEGKIWSHKSRKEAPELVNGDGNFCAKWHFDATYYLIELFKVVAKMYINNKPRVQLLSYCFKHWKTLKMTYS